MLAVIDIDGVVLDFLGAVQSRYPMFRKRNVTRYNLFECNLGLTPQALQAAIEDINVYLAEEKYDGVVSGMRRLRAHGVTTCGWSGVPRNIMNVRQRQIAELGFDTGMVYCGDKLPVQSADAVLDDNPKELEKYLGVCGRLYLVDRQYNRDEGRFTRVKNLYDFAEKLLTNE